MTSFTYKQLVEAVRELPRNKYNNYLQKYILELMEIKECSSKVKENLRKYVSLFLSKLKKKQGKCRKNFDEFVLKINTWLEQKISLPPSLLFLQQHKETQNNIPRGRTLL